MWPFMSLLWAFATLSSIVQSSPTNVDVPNAPKPAAPITTHIFTMQDIEAYYKKNNAVDMTVPNELTLSELENPPNYNITCPDRWNVYYYNWWPILNMMCDRAGSSLDTESWAGTYAGSETRIDRARSVTLKWTKTGDNCKGNCIQAFSTLRNDGPCRGLEFWMKEKIYMDYEGCGKASFIYQYQDQPALENGKGECWNSKDWRPTYLPLRPIVAEFCLHAVSRIRERGAVNFVDDVVEAGQDGFYWTSYDRQVDNPYETGKLYDTGMLHFWAKPILNPLSCPKGKSAQAIIEDEENGLNEAMCIKHILSIENMDCGAPLGKSAGGRVWADCFEWGIEASGYDGIKVDS
ncbi:hypothetical protein CORC01_12132 [Colletotrichum orchidophilum]|uniref:Uncharacterized protein n=1 Tax=Colletotrichum orchidophilum TaxID=1209926 RepID=A0A1G4ATY9_9PEZI|nr:uncharacterized protein CORC01_12132 [Colletotrichum orchidophilum]OHE92553.1 hypothetical protein CORC01_12132 [Colletotrichum orchidophilum]